MTPSFVTVPSFVAVPGLVHGFERRTPGAPAETREAARQRVAKARTTRGRVLFLTQVHGAAVVRAPWDGAPAADAALATAPGLLLAIETADCLPVLFVDPVRRAVAAAHAGWRGTAAGVARAALEALLASGSRREDVRAALGPAIGACCYEVGEEVRAALGPSLAHCFRDGAPRPFFDLRAANRAQLEAAGLAAAAIEDVDECTRCLPERYHSWRRDGAAAGRLIHVIGFVAR
ncbi:MAG: peptidoglycan editing factor PgeF [Vicinamibacteria bacterium]|nr:peptidoglycan editing factor PgeF [Vicinamibacteria bacterium]